MVGKDRLDVSCADEPQAEPEAARSHGRQEARLLVRAEQDRDTRRWLLESLEQGRLGILVHPVRALDDGHPGTALDRHEHQLADEILDPAILRVRATDDDLATWPGRPKAMKVGVTAVLDQPARPAGAARPRFERGGAQQSRRDVEREGRLADPLRTDEEDSLGHGTPDHRGRRGERGRLPSGAGPFHDAVGQTGSAGVVVLRVVRRFGAVSVASPVTVSAAGVAFAAAGLRVARGLAGAFAAGSGAVPFVDPIPKPASSEADAPAVDEADADAAVLRGARGFAGALAAPDVAEVAEALRGARALAGAVAVAGWRVSTWSSVGAAGAGRLTGGFCATWARSNASSSGGTSLHGSFELRPAGAGAGRSPPRL